MPADDFYGGAGVVTVDPGSTPAGVLIGDVANEYDILANEALEALYIQNDLPSMVRTTRLRRGVVSDRFPIYPNLMARNIGETEDLTPSAWNPRNVQITAGEVGIMMAITDLAEATSLADIQQLGMEAGKALAEKWLADVVTVLAAGVAGLVAPQDYGDGSGTALAPTINGWAAGEVIGGEGVPGDVPATTSDADGTGARSAVAFTQTPVGSTGVGLTEANILAAKTQMIRANVQGPFVAVVSPEQYNSLVEDLGSAGNLSALGQGQGVREVGNDLAIRGSGYQGELLQIPFYVSNAVAFDGTDYHGAMFNPQKAVGQAIRWDIRAETDRDASARVTEVVLTACYGAGILDDRQGVLISSV